MDIKDSDLQDLANLIVKYLQAEFEEKHLSGNLVNTIEVNYLNGAIQVHIPAKTYNMLMYQMKGVVIHTSHGSYASKIDKEGSEFYVYPQGGRKGSKLIKPHNHKGYVEDVIDQAVSSWLALKGIKASISKR